MNIIYSRGTGAGMFQIDMSDSNTKVSNIYKIMYESLTYCNPGIFSDKNTLLILYSENEDLLKFLSKKDHVSEYELDIYIDHSKKGMPFSLFVSYDKDRKNILMFVGLESGILKIFKKTIENLPQSKSNIQEIFEIQVSDSPISSIQFNMLDNILYLAGYFELLVILKIDFNSKRYEMRNQPVEHQTKSLALRKDKKVIACGTKNGIRVYSPKGLRKLCELYSNGSSVNCVEYIVNKKNSKQMLLSCSDDGTVSFWDLYN